MPVRLELTKHEAATREFIALCKTLGLEFISNEYHRHLTERQQKLLRGNFSLPALHVRDAPDGIVLGDGVCFRVELKTVSSDGKLRLPLLPYWRACLDAEAGDPVVYVVAGIVANKGGGFRNIRRPASSGSNFSAATSCAVAAVRDAALGGMAHTTDRWNAGHRRLVEGVASDLGVKLKCWPWRHKYSGDPWLEVPARTVKKLRPFIDVVDEIEDCYKDLRK